MHSETANNIIGTQLRLVGAQTWGGGFTADGWEFSLQLYLQKPDYVLSM